MCVCLYKIIFLYDNFLRRNHWFLSIARLKLFFFFFISAYCIIHFLWSGMCDSFHFFLVISYSNNNIKRAHKQSHFRKIFSLEMHASFTNNEIRVASYLRSMCGAIFFNYSCRSSISSGGRRQQVRRVVANKKALFEEERRLENVIASRGRTINMNGRNGSTEETLAAKRIKSRVRDTRGAERRERDRRRVRLPATLLSCRRKKDLGCLFNLVIWKPLSTIKTLVLPTEVLFAIHSLPKYYFYTKRRNE